MDFSSHEDEYAADPVLLMEGDQALIDTMDHPFSQLVEDFNALGSVMKKHGGVVKTLPNGADLLARFGRAAQNTNRLRSAWKQYQQRKPARQAACKQYAPPKRSPITREDLVGRVLTPTPLYAVLDFAVGPLSASIRAMNGQNIRYVKAFHKGIDDPGGPYGSDTPIDYHRTNLIGGGALPDGSTFICHGIDVDVAATDRGEMNATDLRIFGDALLSWGERNGANAVGLARVAECPSTTGIVTAAGAGDPMGLRFTGVPYRSTTPIFTLKGGEKGHEMRVEFPDPALPLVKACRLRIRLHGKHYQRQSGF